jgi:hypothetical protein
MQSDSLILGFWGKSFMPGRKLGKRRKSIEMVLLGWNSHFGNLRGCHISSFACKSTEPTRVLFVRSVFADKRNTALDNCWGNLLVWKEKGKGTIISLLSRFYLGKVLFHRKQAYHFSLTSQLPSIFLQRLQTQVYVKKLKIKKTKRTFSGALIYCAAP